MVRSLERRVFRTEWDPAFRTLDAGEVSRRRGVEGAGETVPGGVGARATGGRASVSQTALPRQRERRARSGLPRSGGPRLSWELNPGQQVKRLSNSGFRLTWCQALLDVDRANCLTSRSLIFLV